MIFCYTSKYKKVHIDTIAVNQWRPELDYIQSVVAVRFTFDPVHPDITFSYDNTPSQYGWDGMTTTYGWPYITHAYIWITPEHKNSWYLGAYETLHALALEHRKGSLLETIMQEGSYLNEHYTVSQAAQVKALPPGAIIDLRALYGTPNGFSDSWG
jgi:hypothetical protein